MKIIIGIVLNLILVALTVLGILAIWGIYPIPIEIISKSGLTLCIVVIGVLLCCLNYVLFFKKEKYRKEGNKAHLID